MSLSGTRPDRTAEVIVRLAERCDLVVGVSRRGPALVTLLAPQDHHLSQLREAGAELAAAMGEVAATFAQVQRKTERMLYHATEKKFHTKRQTYAGAHLRRMNNRYAPMVNFINHGERRGGRTKAHIVESIGMVRFGLSIADYKI